jgi:FMN phosphatase YigB (HAD superfamily)
MALPSHLFSYVYRCSDTVKAWLRSLRSAGVYLFVLTNSFADYATHILEFILGADWASYFDLVIFGGNKPAFFSTESPFLLVNGTEVDGGMLRG